MVRTLESETDWLVNVLRQRMAGGGSSLETLAEALVNAGWALLTPQQRVTTATVLLVGMADPEPTPRAANTQ